MHMNAVWQSSCVRYYQKFLRATNIHKKIAPLDLQHAAVVDIGQCTAANCTSRTL